MAFYVFGGSNSIYKDGWIQNFSERVGQPVLNRSIGATTTLTGIFRFLMSGENEQPSKGDHVIWEYALNDVNHVPRNYRREMLLKNVEHFIILCRNRGCRFIPLIMTPQWQEKAPQRDPYYQMLSDLFRHYRIASFDISLAWRQQNSLQALPDALYADSAHYARRPDLLDFIAGGVADLIPTSRVPAKIAPLYTGGRTLSLAEGLDETFFENSLMRVPATTLPLSIELQGRGHVAAICALFHLDFDSGIRVRLQKGAEDVRQTRFSTTNRVRRRVIVKAVSLEHALGKRWKDRWAFEPGDKFLLSPASLPGEFYAEQEVRAKLDAPRVRPPGRVAAVLIERDPKITPFTFGWLRRALSALRSSKADRGSGGSTSS